MEDVVRLHFQMLIDLHLKNKLFLLYVSNKPHHYSNEPPFEVKFFFLASNEE